MRWHKRVIGAAIYHIFHPNAQIDHHGCTKLYRAARSGKTKKVRRILKGRGRSTIDYQRKDKSKFVSTDRHQGWTALHIAAEHGHTNVVKLLLDDTHGWKAANPDIKDGHSKNPLHIAISSGFYSVLQELLKAGADPHATDSFGSTALHCLAFYRKLHNMALDFDDLTPLLPDRNTPNIIKETPLIIASQMTDEAIVKWLCGATGAGLPPIDANLPDCRGNTPLHYANHARLAEVLLHAGCDLESGNKNGKTPLAEAMEEYGIDQSFAEEQVECLLIHRSKPVVGDVDVCLDKLKDPKLLALYDRALDHQLQLEEAEFQTAQSTVDSDDGYMSFPAGSEGEETEEAEHCDHSDRQRPSRLGQLDEAEGTKTAESGVSDDTLATTVSLSDIDSLGAVTTPTASEATEDEHMLGRRGSFDSAVDFDLTETELEVDIDGGKGVRAHVRFRSSTSVISTVELRAGDDDWFNTTI
ncbi:hypothetical protein J8273_6025 [Carpediemonas membranifera]|uniref:Ankyrin repeat protein n=1 Tax=Carpediemonas membranifera TaxID=201153 RepID=A0A8J6B4D2_9EUKA|nr:hypothetical protein J8273_6025 [Carpediemonas membranifera]|eukprot:KAG9392657.1 hypothetical protein J8273_6025 [Carpediemonas membranifera]